MVSVLEKVSLVSQNEFPQGMKEHICKPPNQIFLKMGLRVYAVIIMDKKSEPNTDAKMSYLQANHQVFKKICIGMERTLTLKMLGLLL